MKSRDIYNNKLDKQSKTYKNEMQNENDHFLKLEATATTRDITKQKYQKEILQREIEVQHNGNTNNMYGYYQLERCCQ